MRNHSCIILYAFVLFTATSFSQKKRLTAVKTGDRMQIDGKLSESIWDSAPVATDFTMFAPDNGKPISDKTKTEVQVVYTNDAIYIGAKLFDNEPSKMLTEITPRDNFGSSENFGIFLNGFNDGQQDFRFYVSAAGVQADCIFTNQNGEDFSWDAIWESHIALTDFGWVVEMKIPYAALRFSKAIKQEWGVNFYREIRRDRQLFTWNFIDTKINNESAQSGILDGIENIETPTRLFFIPYSSFYLNSSHTQKTYGELKGGLDIKYGISDAFTLDAILVPDFGQTKFDNVELNLSPFEQRFTENRPFFTEGTDLFSKGDLVYSRRIGETPDISLADNETAKLPNTIQLINAVKISGRSKDGLGVGFLNAVTENTSVQVTNTNTGVERKAELQPATNYNVVVLDQRFRKNSSVTFINTNVTRNGQAKDANVSAFLFDLNTTKNTFTAKGDVKYSHLNYSDLGADKKGVNTSIYLAETSGNFRYGMGGKYVSKDFDNNDLGINFQTHYHGFMSELSYRILNPTKNHNTFSVQFFSATSFENRTGKVQDNSINLNVESANKKNDFYGYGIDLRPTVTYDFYEARTPDDSKFLKIPQLFESWFYFSSNYNRPFSLDLNPSFAIFNQKGRGRIGFMVEPKYRFNDHLTLSYSFRFNKMFNNIGYSGQDESTNPLTDSGVIVARRDITTYTNSVFGKYAINEKMSLNLTVRHYLSYARNNAFFTLLNSGEISPEDIYTAPDSNFNTWNMDLSYSWWFAPGSQISALYRNNSIDDNITNTNFSSNFNKAIDNRFLNHVFSVSVRYFIDYNSLKN
ncbi:MAG: DUF5916 domain-containing protein [Flavobacterium sp.]|nr:DUF5916 domain-containing protein [Flavobacterium sp.]